MHQNIALRPRIRWSAALLGIIMSGMGQIYNGELLKGLCFFVMPLVTLVAGLRLAVLLPDRYLLAGVVAVILAALLINLAAAVEAWSRAGKIGSHYFLRPYNRWYFYLAIWLLLSVAVGSVFHYIKTNIAQAYRIPSQSMEPAVIRGDMLLADKTYYTRKPPQVGDVVVFVYPDDRSKIFMKRIAALPGTVITHPDGRLETVPHGHVYLLGDNRGKSLDSRIFGFVPLGDVRGKMRQIYFSCGAEGVRWERIGMTPGNSAAPAE
ncbi:MAG: signal peptidase I [Deltaproteobacteria bacterium]|nr:signal peptidase I [Deltaproteobacteria bacterium]MBF0527526.1 signal peptidase I [Deltaproteobacteria bacterium]